MIPNEAKAAVSKGITSRSLSLKTSSSQNSIMYPMTSKGRISRGSSCGWLQNREIKKKILKLMKSQRKNPLALIIDYAPVEPTFRFLSDILDSRRLPKIGFGARYSPKNRERPRDGM
jgi:hypothetical protein